VTGPVAAAEATAALGRAAAWLRTEVAAAVHRRRAPRLTFRFVPEEEGAEGPRDQGDRYS
jgi:hypothetical protein